jgi:hypothetical protein
MKEDKEDCSTHCIIIDRHQTLPTRRLKNNVILLQSSLYGNVVTG